MKQQQVITPRELAEAIGVSESSLKRWVDDGRIHASRTAGGHRRIALPEAIRFIRATQSPLVKPHLLGLHDVETATSDLTDHDQTDQRLYDYLLRGDVARVRGLLMAMYLDGRSPAEIFDGPLCTAMVRLGELWRDDSSGVFVEHRATVIALQAIDLLNAAIEVPEDAAVAVGGAATSDPSSLPPLAASTVIRSQGIATVNLGANCPAFALLQAAEEHHALLIWLSITHIGDRNAVSDDVHALAEACQKSGIGLMIGGRAIRELRLPPTEVVHVGSTLAELAAFVNGVAAAARAISAAS